MSKEEFTAEVCITQRFLITRRDIESDPYTAEAGRVPRGVRMLLDKMENQGVGLRPGQEDRLERALDKWFRPSSGPADAFVSLVGTGRAIHPAPEGGEGAPPWRDELRVLKERLDRTETVLKNTRMMLTRTGQQLTDCEQLRVELERGTQAAREEGRKLKKERDHLRREVDEQSRVVQDLRDNMNRLLTNEIPDLEKRASAAEEHRMELGQRLEGLDQGVRDLEGNRVKQVEDLLQLRTYVDDLTCRLKDFAQRLDTLEKQAGRGPGVHGPGEDGPEPAMFRGEFGAGS